MGETVSMMGNGNSSSASSSMSMTDLDGMVDGLIQSNCVVIFSKTTCSYCKMAKRVFENLGVPYTAVELNQLHNGRDVQKILASMTGSATVRGTLLLLPVI